MVVRTIQNNPEAKRRGELKAMNDVSTTTVLAIATLVVLTLKGEVSGQTWP